MNRHIVVALTLCACSAASADGRIQQGSAIAADPLDRGTWVVDEERDELALISAAGGVASFVVGSWPEKVVVDSGGRVFVSARGSGRIDVVSAQFEFSSIEVGAEPKALVLDEPGRRLYVGLVTEKALAVIDLDSLAVIKKVALANEPHAIARYGKSVAVLPRLSDSVFFVDTCLCKDTPRRILLPNEHAGREMQPHLGDVQRRPWFGQALAVAPEGLLVFHSTIDTGLLGKFDPERLESGGEGYGGGFRPVRAAVSLVEGGRARMISRSEEGFSLPLAEISDAVVRDTLVYAVSRSQSVMHVARLNTKEETGERMRWSPQPAGRGATGLVVDAAGVRTYSAFERKVLFFERNRHARLWLNTEDREAAKKEHEQLDDWGRYAVPGFSGKGPSSGPRVLRVRTEVALGAGVFDPQLALGRELFFTSVDMRVSSTSLSCSTCHFDGRQDGLVWSQNGGHRQTPLLTGKLDAASAPYGWRGEHPTLVTSIESTLKRISGKGLPEPERVALARFLQQGLRPIVRPQPAADPKIVALGQRVFHDPEVGCAGCHPSDSWFTDGSTHDLGTVSKRELQDLRATLGRKLTAKHRELDTPVLKSLALTAPYFHDGSRPSLRAVIDQNNDAMGTTSHLTDEEKYALVAYLETL